MPLPAPDTADGTLDTSIEELARSFERAAQAADVVVERSIRIGDARARLRFAGVGLAEQLSRAFDHLVDEDPHDPELTIDVWDSERSDPPPLPSLAPGSPRGTTVYTADEGRHFASRPALGQLSAYERATSRAWFWCNSANELPFWEPAAPFRQIFHWWLPDRGALLVHGAAVGRAEGGVLLVGAGGSGKSTCALSCLTSDLLYAGDDYVAVELQPEPRVLSLYCSGKLAPDHSALLPHLPFPTFAGDGALEEKSVFYVADRFPERMCRGFPLRAIVAPRVHGDQPQLSRRGPAQVLAALAPSTLLQLVPARQEALSAMAALLGRIPAFGLDVGGPTVQIPPAIERLLGEVAS
jgi:hypothetical protein